MKIFTISLSMSMILLLSGLNSNAQDLSPFNWRYWTDSEYRASLIKKRVADMRANAQRAAPLLGRANACSLAAEIVASPLDWDENSQRIAKIPITLRVYGLDFNDDFKRFQASAVALIEFSAQIQSVAREEFTRRLASERERTSHNLTVEANTDPMVIAKYLGSSDSERQSSSEKASTVKHTSTTLTEEQAATFRKLYSQLLADYEPIAKQFPSQAELMGDLK